MAGSEFTLTCIVSEIIVGFTNMPSAVWLLAGTNVSVPSGGDITITSTRSNNTATAILNFNPLRTSHSVSYICRGLLMSPAQENPIITTKRTDLHVQCKLIISMLEGWLVVILCPLIRYQSHLLVCQYWCPLPPSMLGV